MGPGDLAKHVPCGTARDRKQRKQNLSAHRRGTGAMPYTMAWNGALAFLKKNVVDTKTSTKCSEVLLRE